MYTNYAQTLVDLRSTVELPSFQKIRLESGKCLMISDLITIADFHQFEDSNTRYLEDREELVKRNGVLDNLEAVNADEDKTLPVSLT